MFREFRTLLPYFRKYRWYYVGGVVSLIVTSGAQLLVPQVFRIAVDTINAGQFPLSRILELMLRLGGIAVLIAAGRFGWRFFIIGTSRKIERELRHRIFSHLETLSPSYFGRTKIGDLMARSTNDLNAIRMASGMALIAFMDGLFMTVAIVVILLGQNARVALLTIIPLPFITAIIILIGRLIGGLFKKVQEGFSTLSEQTQEVFSGVQVIKSFVQEGYFLSRFRDANEEYQSRNMELVRLWGLFFPLVRFLAGMTTLILLRYGGAAILRGELSAGEFVATLSYLEMLIWPMLGAGFTVNMIQRGGASLGRVNRVLEEEPEIQSPSDPAPVPAKRDIEVRSLTFGYDEPILRDVSFRVREGGILGVLGRTGSGKTTLVNLLPRMLDTPAASVFVGGTDVTTMDLTELRTLFAVVPQDTFLFSASIRDNIAFAAADGDDETIDRVAQISTITRDIKLFPNGLDTQVGERGITLSGGQKQRVAIARALASGADILILDDALSAVDTETEEQILGSLLEYRTGKTTIVISHRVSTLQFADSILVLEHGQVTQSGTHETLVREEGFYQEIHELQRLETIGGNPDA